MSDQRTAAVIDTPLTRQRLSADATDAASVAVLLERVADQARSTPGWRSWRFDRTPGGRIEAWFEGSEQSVRVLRRHARHAAVALLVHLPERIEPESSRVDDLERLIEQAASDFAVHILCTVPEGDPRRAAVRAVTSNLARACLSLYPLDDAGADLDRSFEALGRDPSIATPMATYLLVLSEAVLCARAVVPPTALQEVGRRHVAATVRRLGGAVVTTSAGRSPRRPPAEPAS